MILTNLTMGQKGEIIDLSAEGKKRRRLLDLGLIPGTTVKAKWKSPAGDPIAFLIKGTILALRSEETKLVQIK